MLYQFLPLWSELCKTTFILPSCLVRAYKQSIIGLKFSSDSIALLPSRKIICSINGLKVYQERIATLMILDYHSSSRCRWFHCWAISWSHVNHRYVNIIYEKISYSKTVDAGIVAAAESHGLSTAVTDGQPKHVNPNLGAGFDHDFAWSHHLKFQSSLESFGTLDS